MSFLIAHIRAWPAISTTGNLANPRRSTTSLSPSSSSLVRPACERFSNGSMWAGLSQAAYGAPPILCRLLQNAGCPPSRAAGNGHCSLIVKTPADASFAEGYGVGKGRASRRRVSPFGAGVNRRSAHRGARSIPAYRSGRFQGFPAGRTSAPLASGRAATGRRNARTR